MKQILTLASWNCYMARRWYSGLCAAFAVQQLIVLLILAATPDFARQGYTACYNRSLQWLALCIVFVAAGVISARNLMANSGRTRAGYTLLTLPVSPASKLAAQTLSAAAMELGVIALQILMAFVYYWPVQALANHVTAGLYDKPMPQPLFYEQLARNEALRVILPVRPGQVAMLLIMVLAAAILLPGIFCHHGLNRAVAILLAVAGAVNCLLAVVYETYVSCGQEENYGTGFWVELTILLVVTLVSAFWSFSALRSAEAAG